MLIKRIFAMLMIVSLTIGCFVFVTVSATEMATLSIGSIEGKAGDTVTVDVSISGNPGFSGIWLYLDYDGSMIKAISVESGDMLKSDLSASNINLENEVKFAWVTLGGDMKADGVLYSITFELLQDVHAGEEGFRLWHGEWDLFNSEYESVPTNVLVIDTNAAKIEIDSIESVMSGDSIIFTGTSNKPIDALFCLLTDENGNDVSAGFIKDTGNGTFSGEIMTIGIDAGSYRVQIYITDSETGTSRTVRSAGVEILPSGKFAVIASADEGGVAFVVVDGKQENNGSFAPGDTVTIITAVSNGGLGYDPNASYSFVGWESSVPVEFASQEPLTSFVMPEANVIIYAKFSKTGGTTDPSDSKYPTDIAGHWAEDYIKNVFDKTIMSGYPDGTFLPEKNLTRAEFATAMVNFLGLEPEGTTSFADANGHWAEPYIATLIEAGIVTGYDENTFGVGDNVTREQIALILVRAFNPEAELSGDTFADDANISNWAKDAVYIARAMGWMQGDDSGFRPTDGAKRAEIATVLSRLQVK